MNDHERELRYEIERLEFLKARGVATAEELQRIANLRRELAELEWEEWGPLMRKLREQMEKDQNAR
jgi:hypothetical protein